MAIPEIGNSSFSKQFPNLLETPYVSAALCVGDAIPKKREFYGALGGLGLAIPINTTGAGTALHEVVGHGYLGNRLTNTYAHGQGPSYQVVGWDNLKNLGGAHSFKQGFIDFFRWIGDYNPNHNGVDGTTNYGHPEHPNGIGEAMGTAGQSAWVSIAGPMPELVLDVLSVLVGMHLRRRSPALGSLLVSFGLVDHSINAYYCIDAARMSESHMEKAATQGHDFANFAVQMSHVTGLSAETIAITTASLWTAIVPLAALAAYMHTKSNAIHAVPDLLAMKHWLSKAENREELERGFDAYPKKEALEKILNREISEDLSLEEIKQIQDETLHFIDYLLEKMPSQALDASKKEILEAVEKKAPTDRVQTALNLTAATGNVAIVAAKTLTFFSETVAPSLHIAAKVLSYASPFLMVASVLSAAYQVYKDFQCPNEMIPMSAKLLSIARFVVSVVYAILLLTALFVPGLNLLFIFTLVIGCLMNIFLSFARMIVIRSQFARNQVLKPETQNIMLPLWHVHQQKPKGTKMGPVLAKWVECVKRYQPALLESEALRA